MSEARLIIWAILLVTAYLIGGLPSVLGLLLLSGLYIWVYSSRRSPRDGEEEEAAPPEEVGRGA